MVEAPQDRWSRRWLIHALWGVAVFAAICIAQPFTGLRAVGGIGYLLIFAALVVIPLGASLAVMSRQDGTSSSRWQATGAPWVYRFAARTHPLAAVAAIAALAQPVGTTAAALAGPWLLQALALASFGAYRLRCHGFRGIDQLAIDVGLLQLPIGAAWWIATCAGWRFGFSDLIVQLTAIHFHYAGFAAPVVYGLAGRGVDPEHRLLRGLYQAACWTVLLAVWIVAGGIAAGAMPAVPIWISVPIEFAGTAAIAAGMLLLAGLLCLHLPRQSNPPVNVLFVVAGLSLALPMALAVAYASGRLFGWPLLTIPEMARWHGFLNAFGFAGAGLTAFALWRPPARSTRKSQEG